MLPFEYLRDYLKALWESWAVEFLVLLNFFFQTFLTFYGGRRKYEYKYRIRVLVWLSYVLSSRLPSIILGKLTIIPVDGDLRYTHSELLPLMAPLTLMQMGNTDGITAFSMEDSVLGLRQILNLVIQIVLVIYILVRSWTNSLISYIYLPMFLAGIIKYGEASWALITALDCSRMTILLSNKKIGLEKLITKGSAGDYGSDARLIVKAYCRFFRLRPHLEKWPYQTPFKKDDWLSIDELTTDEIFRVTESELGFMYDVLYTKAPVVYTRTGCILRIISFFSLTGTLYGFIALFKDAFIYQIDVGFIYFVLAASVILETYQILLLPFSDWAIVLMIKHSERGGILEKFSKILAPQTKRWRKWSHSLEQFNLLDFCLDPLGTKISQWTIFRYCFIDMKLRTLWSTSRIAINNEVKELIVTKMKEIDEKRNHRPFTEVGRWTMERYGIKDDDLIMKIFGQNFDKCIFTWHVATDIFYYGRGPQTAQTDAIRMISNYMMFFLARRPHVLGTTAVMYGPIEQIKPLLTYGSEKLREGLKEIIVKIQHRTDQERDRFFPETPFTEGWLLPEDVNDLVLEFESRADSVIWELIGSAWIEMMCYAASNCEMKDHAKHLWQGGELITHVWLLLAHNTNKPNALNAGRKSNTLDHPTSPV